MKLEAVSFVQIFYLQEPQKINDGILLNEAQLLNLDEIFGTFCTKITASFVEMF